MRAFIFAFGTEASNCAASFLEFDEALHQWHHLLLHFCFVEECFTVIEQIHPYFAAFKSSLQRHRALFDRYGSVFHTCGKLSSSLRYQSVEWQKKSWIVSDKYSPRNCKCNNIVWEAIVTSYSMQHYRIPVQQTVDGVSSLSIFFERMTSKDIFPLEKTCGRRRRVRHNLSRAVWVHVFLP